MKDTRGDLDEWRKAALEKWTDHRIVDDDWLDTHIWFFMHAYADWNQIGCEFTGFSLRQRYGEWLLVVKLLKDGVPYIVFVSSSTPTRSMRKLKDLLRNGGVKLNPDKFA